MDAQDMDGLRTQLEAAVAKEEIRQALARYCRGMDRNDAALSATSWHADGVADFGSYFRGSGAAWCAKAVETHERDFLSHAHEISTCIIEVAGDRAASETYVATTYVLEKDGQQILKTVRGRYLDQWSRRDGRWAIDVRGFVRNFAYDQPMDFTVGEGKRSAKDRSYDLFRKLEAA